MSDSCQAQYVESQENYIFPDWKCTICNFIMFGTRSECKKCGTQHLKNGINPNTNWRVKARPADWICPNCNFSIFGSKLKCSKCNCLNPTKSDSN